MVKNNKEQVFQRIYFSLKITFKKIMYVTTYIITVLASISVILNVKKFGKLCFFDIFTSVHMTSLLFSG